MPRRPRLNLTDMPLHVIQRGNNRQACFFDEEDYQSYLYCLKKGAEKYSCDVHAYVLMTNHVHLLVTPHDADGVSKLMQSIGRRYVQYVNRIYRRSGTLCEGRFKASLVNAEEYLLRCYRYIELNPGRAGMVRDPGEYRWSSYRHHALGVHSDLIRDHVLFKELGGGDKERRQIYCALFRSELDEAELTDISKAANEESILGAERFKEEIEEMLGRRIGPGRQGRGKVQCLGGIENGNLR